jgi:DNA-binding SARP family transcriptional activator/tetratricopeptide (TPR) repeat protein
MRLVWFRILGPVEVESDDGGVHTLTRRQERGVLAVLLLNPGRAVPVDRFIGLLWDDHPPGNPRQALHSHISRIRRLLDQAGAADHDITLTSHRHGYQLTLDPELVDAHRFRRLVNAATQTVDLSERDRLLSEALALWRGPALNHPTSDPLRQRLCADLDELHLQAHELAIATGIDLGRHQQLLPDLARLAAEHPTRQRLTELHMHALHRAGRTADALDIYQATRLRLADTLGIDPDPALRHLHTAILRDQPTPVAGPPTHTAPQAARVVPAQLPADPAGFTGRGHHLRRLDALLPDPTTGAADTAVVITAIDGTAGIGKTTLAVHWAHHIRDRFPDGQLYVNLRGFDTGGQATDPATAVRGFLDALGIPPQRIPTDPDAQTALYRSLLTDKRMLIVLDNARNSTQIRPLLPGAPGCLVIITSRNQLTSLIAETAAHPVTLGLLTPDEARDLLAHRLGTHRINTEPAAVEEIITRCARLPLALTLVAAHAALHPHTDLHVLAEQLRDTQQRWQTLTGDDTDIRSVFSWSYQSLTPDAARLFRLLGLHPGPDVAEPAAASLTALSTDEARPLLAELTQANLIAQHRPGRYTLHDLLRAYATQLAHTTDAESDRRDAIHRMLDHYLHTGWTASALLNPQRTEFIPEPPYEGSRPEPLADYNGAMAWYTAEHRVLLASLEHATRTGFDGHVWELAWVLAGFLERRGHWEDWTHSQHMALAAAKRSNDRLRQAHAHRSLGRAYSRLGRSDDAYIQYSQASQLYRDVDDLRGQARTHTNLALLLEQSQRYLEALQHACQALDLEQELHDGVGYANALNTVGWCHALVGEYEQTVAYCRQAIARHQDINDRDGEAATWDTLGYAHHHLGDHRQAVACYRRAIDLFRELGDHYDEAVSLMHLGDVNDAMGDSGTAEVNWRQAVQILDELGHPTADQVRAKLNRGGAAVTPLTTR